MRVNIRRVTLRATLLIIAFFVIQSLVHNFETAAAEREQAMLNVDDYKELSQSNLQMDLGTSSYSHQKTDVERTSREAITAVLSLQEPVECDAALAYLDDAFLNTIKLAGTNLIIIARLGSGERSSQLNKSRLSWIKSYMSNRVPDLKYVIAEGGKVSGLGRVELYVGGRLLHTMPIKKNAKHYCVVPIGI